MSHTAGQPIEEQPVVQGNSTQAAQVTAPSPTTTDSHEIKVFSAPVASTSTTTNPDSTSSETSPPTNPQGEPNDAYFEPSLSDVQSYHASVISRSKRLNEAPLLTSKHRDEDKALREKKKAEKWPTTTIRVKFSDGTQVQSSFASTSAIQPVYAFVRSALKPEYREKIFTLWQPPRFTYPEHPLPPPPKKANASKGQGQIIPPANYGYVRGNPTAGLMGGSGGKESLNDLGLVPQSVLMVKWEDESMNVTGYPAPLLEELMEKVVPLPPPEIKEGGATKQATAGPSSGGGTGSGEKKIPKWLQKGLMKRK